MRRVALPLLISFWSQAALGPALGVFANPQGTDCNLVIPYPGGTVTAYVVGTIDGSEPLGVSSANFRIGLPEGWAGGVLAVDPGAAGIWGNPFVGGIDLTYNHCVTGSRVLLTVVIAPTTVVDDASVVILPATDPFLGNPCGEPCPLFWSCNDGSGGYCHCAEPLRATINGAPCSVGVQNSSWGRVRDDLQVVSGARSTSCDRFGIPSTSHWTGAAIIVKWSQTKTCIVTRSRTSSRPMPSSWPGDLRNDGGSVAAAGADGSDA